jgi:predicted transcriptional regulator
MTTPKIQAIIANFVSELTAALSAASHEALTAALGGDAKGGKRSSEDLAKLTQSLLTYVKRKPGQRIEQIGAALELATKELALPAKKLIAEKKLSTKGQKRATVYFAK